MDTNTHEKTLGWGDIPISREQLRSCLKQVESYRGAGKSVVEGLDLSPRDMLMFSCACCETLCFQEEEAKRPLPAHLLAILSWRQEDTAAQWIHLQRHAQQCSDYTEQLGLRLRKEKLKSSQYYALCAHQHVVRSLHALLGEEARVMALEISLAAQDYAEDTAYIPYADPIREGKQRSMEVFSRTVRRAWGREFREVRENFERAWRLPIHEGAVRREERCWQAKLLAGLLRYRLQTCDLHDAALQRFQRESQEALFSAAW